MLEKCILLQAKLKKVQSKQYGITCTSNDDLLNSSKKVFIDLFKEEIKNCDINISIECNW